MLSRCLNPSCDSRFLFLHDGRIFNVERSGVLLGDIEPQNWVEQYWLCGTCCRSLKVIVENGSVTTEPIRLLEFEVPSRQDVTTLR